MRYLSLFSGIGGFELGIQQAYENNRSDLRDRNTDLREDQPNAAEQPLRPTCVGFSEIDEYAASIYQYHFPNHHNYGDITKITAETLPDFDLLVGGFPCQAFSIAGKRKGFDDTRGTLFFEIARLLQAKKPRLLFLENVKGLLNHDNGRTFTTIIATLDELGYDLQWQVLNSKDFGVPQNRERVFIVGHFRGTARPQVFPFGNQDGASAREINVVGNTNRNGRDRGNIYDADGIVGALTATDYKQPKQIVQINNPKHSNDRVYDPSGLAPTLNTMQGGDRQPFIFEGATVRRLTPLECERLQGFPDQWTSHNIIGPLSDTRRYKALGNAVTVNVIQAIVERIYA